MNLQATFAATLVDEWVRCGLADAVVCPGSRSTPLALALASAEAAGRLRIHVFLDERSGGFAALGIALGSGRPALVLTTSGTAAVELHPAVVEAAHAGVPLIACTADRPGELRDVGAPQTIDQLRLFGGAARWFVEASADLPPSAWRSIAARAWVEAMAGGPVQVNLPFREPLVGEPQPVPEPRGDREAWHAAPAPPESPVPPGVVRLLRTARRGLVVAGRGASALGPLGSAARAAGWVVLADPLSGWREPGAVGAFDAIVRCGAFAGAHRPDVVLQTGAPPASRALNAWLDGLGVPSVVATPHGWPDPSRKAASVLRGASGLGAALAEVLGTCEPGWQTSWLEAEAAAQSAIDAVLADRDALTEPFVARSLAAAMAHGSSLVVASSMPVRDLEWYARPRAGLRVLANRGANGIDGVVSTALGVALAAPGTVTAALVGDLAFLHDVGALLWAGARPCRLTVVVVDNDGGGIFSFLPQAALVGDVFERLFATPHRTDLRAVAAAYGVTVERVDRAKDLDVALAGSLGRDGVQVLVARTDRGANVAVHEELNRAVAAALA